MDKLAIRLFDEVYLWIEKIFSCIPGLIGCLLRRFFYNLSFKCGNNFSVEDGCVIRGGSNILIGNGVSLGRGSQISAVGQGSMVKLGNRVGTNHRVMINADFGGSIDIHENVIIGPNVVIRAVNHQFSNREQSIRDQGHVAGKIIIERDVWVGANVVILPDVTIGAGAIVGAGAVVTKNVESFTIVGGVPAVKIGDR